MMYIHIYWLQGTEKRNTCMRTDVHHNIEQRTMWIKTEKKDTCTQKTWNRTVVFNAYRTDEKEVTSSLTQLKEKNPNYVNNLLLWLSHCWIARFNGSMDNSHFLNDIHWVQSRQLWSYPMRTIEVDHVVSQNNRY